MSKSGGGSQTKKQLGLVFIVMVALFLHAPPGLGIGVACVLFALTLVAVFHNGVQLFDFIVAFALGVFCARGFAGTGTHNVINTVANWIAGLVT